MTNSIKITGGNDKEFIKDIKMINERIKEERDREDYLMAMRIKNGYKTKYI